MNRDKARAVMAYGHYAAVPAGSRDKYKIVVNGFCGTMVRGGLASAMSYLERLGQAANLFRDHLATALSPMMSGPVNGQNLPSAVRALPDDSYMLVSREALRVMVWYKRAIQA